MTVFKIEGKTITITADRFTLMDRQAANTELAAKIAQALVDNSAKINWFFVQHDKGKVTFIPNFTALVSIITDSLELNS